MPENNAVKHSLNMTNRNMLSISGVNDVQGFDEQTVSLKTDCGSLLIKGNELHISKLSLESKDVCIDGTINSLQYINDSSKNLRSRLFK